EEVDLICGVYVVETEQSGAELSQAAHRSWWPRPSVFQSSGLNIGLWSRDCEKWFQQRLRECVGEKPQLMNSTKWRNAMNMKIATRHTPDKNVVLAAAFIEDVLGVKPAQ
ncbi:hypothetical protein V5O48_019119, partial [Marasmius crinis-equi]